MRNGFRQISCILHFIGNLLEILGLILLFPLIVVLVHWGGEEGDGVITAASFVIASLISFSLGMILRHEFKPAALNPAGSMLICALSWLIVSAIGALPFVIAARSNYLDAYFEAMSGFTTTGITIFSELHKMPRSLIFWRAITQWLGGIGILSFFLVLTFQAGGAHHIIGAESHKISSRRPAPGLFHTIRIIWTIYVVLTLLAVVVLAIERMPVFDAVCHGLTSVATGGFSPYDSSIGYYYQTGHPHYRLIEYTLALIMMLGGINFLIHYRILTKDFKALWDNVEIRYWWRLIAVFVIIIMIERLYRTGAFEALFMRGVAVDLVDFERSFRHSLFQVISILTTSGFTTMNISSDFFGVAAKQLFLVMMVIGGCVGSTAGGFKVLRIAILNRLMFREIFKLRTSSKASTGLIIDRKILPEEEAHRIAALFFTWMALLLFGGVITALFSNHGPWASFSGMFSAMGNIGPCYISGPDMIDIHPVVKLTYIFGMLAGRLEILPVLLLFSGKAWR
ncbi:MAG: TrkH family potassium uptake protein [Planctomycetes bacterium]|nr:TrkH family potassium uptake protein [Planctomycetota bacterium]MBL7146208.1 TrkH family potassium uptake protein [Phycisphaerae bacterium]